MGVILTCGSGSVLSVENSVSGTGKTIEAGEQPRSSWMIT